MTLRNPSLPRRQPVSGALQIIIASATHNTCDCLSLEDVAGKSDASRSLGDPFGRHGEVVVDLDSLGDAGEGCCCVAGVKT